MNLRFILFWACAALVACAPDAERAVIPEPPSEAIDAVNGLMAAFNEHDPDEMRTFWLPDVTWIEITGNQSSIVTTSADQLYEELVAYFKAYPSVSSSLENISARGNYVMAVERPVWEENGERKTNASIVVYEVIEGKVRRFWYFPPQS
jgi:hypothetical protein